MDADQRSELRFRNADEKQAAIRWATKQGHQSLNAYFMWLYRQDVLKNTAKPTPAESQQSQQNRGGPPSLG
jgi:hypothetical protein